MVTGIKGEELVSPHHRSWRWVGSVLSMLCLPQHLLAQSGPADARVARWWRRLAACYDESRQASPAKQTRGNSSRPKHKHSPSRETGGKRRSRGSPRKPAATNKPTKSTTCRETNKNIPKTTANKASWTGKTRSTGCCPPQTTQTKASSSQTPKSQLVSGHKQNQKRAKNGKCA